MTVSQIKFPIAHGSVMTFSNRAFLLGSSLLRLRTGMERRMMRLNPKEHC